MHHSPTAVSEAPNFNKSDYFLLIQLLKERLDTYGIKYVTVKSTKDRSGIEVLTASGGRGVVCVGILNELANAHIRSSKEIR